MLRSRLSVSALLVLVSAAGCVSVGSPAAHQSTSPGPFELPVPANFEQACRLESQVCIEGTGKIPSELLRPLHLPTLEPGQPCPTTSGQRVVTAAFGGIALGSGLVRPLIAADGDTAHGVARLDPPTGEWYGFKTLWFSDPSYQGPWIVRGAGLGHPGFVAFGEQPSVSELVIPPGDTVNERDGWREAPGGTWVSGPGCYAWQVDGLGFSAVIVFKAVIS